MARVSRSRAAAAALRTPTPQITEQSDGESPSTPQPDGSLNADNEGDQMSVEAEDEDADLGSPAGESDEGSAPATPASIRGVGRRRRGGRVRGSIRRRDPHSQDTRDNGSDTATPRKRGGWRGRGFGAGRWAKVKGGPSHVTQVPIDKEGNMANIINDEVELSEDPEGEQKVSKEGELSGGREYRVRTFRIEGKRDRLYMLSTEPARCIGFRDSYLFFQKHKQLYKIIIAEDAKKDLIDRGIIPHSYKGRAIGVVTARSVFREFGSKIIVGGKKVTDDYLVAEARARGDVEGEFAVPDDELPGGNGGYDRNRYVAWHGASSVYHTGAPSVPLINGKPQENKKKKVVVTGANWMYEHALQASRFNSQIASHRRQTLDGVYNVHTNFMQYPKIMQPTHARWEQIETAVSVSDGLQNANGVDSGGHRNDASLRFDRTVSEMPAFYAKKFMVTDAYYEGRCTSTLGYPGPDEAAMDVDPPGLTDISADIIAKLPDECRDQLIRARAKEEAWKGKWGTEEESTLRARLEVTYNV